MTMLLFFIIEFLASMRYIQTYPMYCLMVTALCGPVWIVTVLVHEWGHLYISRRKLDDHEEIREIVLWPLGGYTFCDGLSSEDRGRRGDLRTDIEISLAGPFMHIPMGIFWFLLYAAINNGVSGFSFRSYLTVVSSGANGYFSTLCEQACLVNILILWFNIFLPAYPLDGSKLFTSSMLLMGVALNKAALLNLLMSVVVSIALLIWSIVSFADGGVGVAGLLTVLVVLFVAGECRRLYQSIVGGRLRYHPLFGRDCYIHRDTRANIFQMSAAARNTQDEGAALEHNDNATEDTEVDQTVITGV